MSFLSSLSIDLKPPVTCGIPLSHRDKIVKDLTRKVPVGPTGEANAYKATLSYKSGFYCDYSPIILFQLGIRERPELREIINSLFYPDLTGEEIRAQRKAGTVTMYLNRVWPVIKSAIIDARMIGGPGIYEVYDYRFYIIMGGVMGYVYADDMSTAKILGQTIFGFVAPSGKLRVRYVEYGDRSSVDMLNVSLLAKLSENRKNAKDRVEALEDKLLYIAAHIDVISDYVSEP